MARLTDDEQPLPEIHLSIYRETASIVHSTLFRTSRTIPHHPAGAWSHPLQSAAPNVAEVSRPPQCCAAAPQATKPQTKPNPKSAHSRPSLTTLREPGGTRSISPPTVAEVSRPPQCDAAAPQATKPQTKPNPKSAHSRPSLTTLREPGGTRYKAPPPT